MGLHSWFYAKIQEQPTYEIVLDFYIQKLEEKIEFLNGGYIQKFLDDTFAKELYQSYAEDANMQLDVYMVQAANLYKRKLQIVKKGLCKEAVKERVCFLHTYSFIEKMGWEENTRITYDRDSGMFYQETPFHDCFRHGNYKAPKLYSLQQTLDFINNERVYSVNMESIHEFWEKYPDGMIQFG
jgi:hypothetical protein